MINKNKILQIVDVNLNRASEGLRVAEEICRFILQDQRSTATLKRSRGELFSILAGRQFSGLIEQRRAGTDLGRELYTLSEGRRLTLSDIFRANFKRAQEAVRCLEEFSKLLAPRLGQRYKTLRFKLYSLEKELLPEVIKIDKLDFGLYVVTDPKLGHLKTLKKVLAAGARIVQIRDKNTSEKEYEKLARQALRLAKRGGATFILNDHWKLVKKLGADGVHLGQEDLKLVSLEKVRSEIGADKIIGLSTHSYEQAVQGEKLGADYISIGPIFATPSKPTTRPVGLQLLAKVLKKINIPVVAIGGIGLSNIDKVRRAGCQRIAVIRAAEELLAA